jgi:hypothetical protein
MREERGGDERTCFSASISSMRCSYSVFWTGRLVKVEGWGWARFAGGAMAALTCHRVSRGDKRGMMTV